MPIKAPDGQVLFICSYVFQQGEVSVGALLVDTTKSKRVRVNAIFSHLFCSRHSCFAGLHVLTDMYNTGEFHLDLVHSSCIDSCFNTMNV